MRKFDGFSLGEMMMEFYLSRMISHDIALFFFLFSDNIDSTFSPPSISIVAVLSIQNYWNNIT